MTITAADIHTWDVRFSKEMYQADAAERWPLYTRWATDVAAGIKSGAIGFAFAFETFRDVAERYFDLSDPSGLDQVFHMLETAQQAWEIGRVVRGDMEMSLRLAADIKPQAISWLWEGHLARGMLKLLTGPPDLGKSQVHCSMVATVTTGQPWPDKTPCKIGNVLMLVDEDSIEQTVIPRLLAAGADLNRVRFVEQIRPINHPTHGRVFRLTPADIAFLGDAVKKWGASLLTMDPITAYLSAKADSHKATDVRGQLSPLREMVERSNVAGSAITHPAKVTSNRALDQFIGSQAFVAVPRLGHIVVKEFDPATRKETGRKLLAVAKCNIWRLPATLAFRTEQLTVGYDEERQEPVHASHVVWDGVVRDMNADKAVAQSNAVNKGKPGPSGETLKQAVEFLRDQLRDGPIDVKDVKDAATGHGISWRTVERAKTELKIRAKRVGALGEKAKWSWELPKADVVRLATRDGERVIDRDPVEAFFEDNVPEQGEISEADLQKAAKARGLRWTDAFRLKAVGLKIVPIHCATGFVYRRWRPGDPELPEPSNVGVAELHARLADAVERNAPMTKEVGRCPICGQLNPGCSSCTPESRAAAARAHEAKADDPTQE